MLIFDMDGTLIDSNGIWRDVDTAFLAKRGLPYTREYYEGVAHTVFPKAAIFTKEYCHLSESTDEIMAEWMEMAGDLYTTSVPVKPGVVDYLEKCKAAGERMAVLTSSVPTHCHAALGHLGLNPYRRLPQRPDSGHAGHRRVRRIFPCVVGRDADGVPSLHPELCGAGVRVILTSLSVGANDSVRPDDQSHHYWGEQSRRPYIIFPPQKNGRFLYKTQIFTNSYSRVPSPIFSPCSRQLRQSVSGWMRWKWSWAC